MPQCLRVPSERCISNLKRQNAPSLRDFTEGVFLLRGLKSTVTTSSEPTALLGLRNMSQLVRNSYELPQTAKTT